MLFYNAIWEFSSIEYSAGTVFIRQNLTHKDGPHTERIKIFPMAINPLHRYSNETERANQDNNGCFKLKKNLRSQWLIQKNSAL